MRRQPTPHGGARSRRSWGPPETEIERTVQGRVPIAEVGWAVEGCRFPSEGRREPLQA